MRCECNGCQLSRRVKSVKEIGTAAEKNALIDELYERWFYASDDLDYMNAIKDGGWPDAVEILEKWLANAKEKKKP